MSADQLSFQQLSLNPIPPPSITLTKDPTRSRKTRNRQYIPSDDEDEDDLTTEEDDDDNATDDEFDNLNKQRSSGRRPSPSTSTMSSSGKQQQHKKVTPLPSDDEDDEDDEDVIDSEDEYDDHFDMDAKKNRVYRLQGVQSTSQLGSYISKPTHTLGQAQRHSADESNAMVPSPSTTDISSYDSDDDCVLLPQQKLGPSGGDSVSGDNFLVNGSQLQQWQYMQQYHQAQMAQFNQRQQLQQQQRHQPHPIKSHSSSSHLRHQYQQQQSLSGMELMTQLEQDKAEAKRQKPKLNPTHAKIQGLLAKLPEPGAHNISFQHVYQQQQQQQQQHHHYQHHHRRQQQHGFNRTTASVGRSPSPTPSTRSCAPTMMMMQQQQQQPMMTIPGAYNMYGYPVPSYYYQQQQQQLQQQQPSFRSGSAMSVNRP
ncbi:unnamed protein product [Absidia cylindrospora]